MIRDEEDLIKDVLDFVKTNLNTKIAAINTEKGDFDIDTITADTDHYLVAGEMTDFPNNPFVVLGIDGEIENQNVYNDLSSTVPITVKVAFPDPSRPNTYYKALRYMRALAETMLDYEPATIEVGGLQITKSMPMLVQAENRQIVTSGITVNIGIG